MGREAAMKTAGPDLAIAISCILASICALTLNGVLFFLILRNKELRQMDFVYFILNRALADSIVCLLGTLQFAAILSYDSDSKLCIAVGFLAFVVGSASFNNTPFLAFNRYIAISWTTHYQRLFTRRALILMCAACWVLGAGAILPHLFLNSLGRVTGSFCGLKFTPANMILEVSINFPFLLIAVISVCFFYTKMYLSLKAHQHQCVTNHQKTQLQDDREMSKYIFISGLLPIILQLPVMILMVVELSNPISPWIIFVAESIVFISFIVEPAITLFMVRPIRKELIDVSKKVFGGHQNEVVEMKPVGRVMAGHREQFDRA